MKLASSLFALDEKIRYAAVNQNPGAAEKKTLLQWLQAQGVDKHITSEAKATICSPTSKVKDWVEVKLDERAQFRPVVRLGGPIEGQLPNQLQQGARHVHGQAK